MENWENWKINKLQDNYLFTNDLIFTYVGKYGGPTWYVNKIRDVVFINNNIHLIFYNGKDVELDIIHKKQEIFIELKNLYFNKK